MYAKIDSESSWSSFDYPPASPSLSVSSRLPLLPLVCSSSRYCLIPVPPLSVSQGNRQSFKQPPSSPSPPSTMSGKSSLGALGQQITPSGRLSSALSTHQAFQKSLLPSLFLPLLCLLLLLLDSRAPRKLLFSSYFAQRFLLFFLCSGIFRLRFRAVSLPPCLLLSVLPVPGHRLGSVLGPLFVPGSLFVLSAADLARICWQRLLCLGLPPVDDVWDFLAIFIYLKMKRRTHKVNQGGGEKSRRRRRDHSCKGGFNVALICGNRALNVAIFEVKLLELFDAMRCETSRGGVRGGEASPDEKERQLPTMKIQLPLPLLLLWFRSACLPASSGCSLCLASLLSFLLYGL